MHGQGWGGARAPPPTRPRPSASTTRGAHNASLTASTPPYQREPLVGHTRTPPWRGPEEDTGLREDDTTARPQAPEGQPGALQGHHRGSNEARSPTHAGARGMAAAQPSPPRGGPLAGHTPGRRSKRICLCPKTKGPTRHPKAGDRRPKVRAGGHTPTPAFLTFPKGQGGKTGEGPRGQTEKSGHVHRERPSLVRRGLGPARESTTTPHQSVEPEWRAGGEGTGEARRGEASHRRGPLSASPAASKRQPPPHAARSLQQPHASGEGGQRPPEGGERLTRGTEPTGRGSSQPPPGARSGEAQSHKDPQHLAPHRPRVAQRPEVAQPQAGSARHTTQEPAHRPNQAPAGGPKAQSPACIQRPKVLGGRHQRRPCRHLPGGKKYLFRATK